MSKLKTCPSCGTFVPEGARACVECRAARPAELPRWLRVAIAVGGSSALAMTLSACYGGPCAAGTCGRTTPANPTATCQDPSQDMDGDGYCGPSDCDEEDPRTHRGVPDAEGDGIDRNCDGLDGEADAGGR